jgi:hypothetical protein
VPLEASPRSCFMNCLPGNLITAFLSLCRASRSIAGDPRIYGLTLPVCFSLFEDAISTVHMFVNVPSTKYSGFLHRRLLGKRYLLSLKKRHRLKFSLLPPSLIPALGRKISLLLSL